MIRVMVAGTTLGVFSYWLASLLIRSGFATVRYEVGTILWLVAFIACHLLARRQGVRGLKLFLSGPMMWVVASVVYYVMQGLMQVVHPSFDVPWLQLRNQVILWVVISMLCGLIGAWAIEVGLRVIDRGRVYIGRSRSSGSEE